VATLVVGRDGNVDVLGRRVGVAEGDDRDVDVRGLLDGLGVGAGIRDDDQAGLLERPGDVVGEGTGGEAAGNGLGAGVGGELEDGTLAVGTSRDDANIARVVNGSDDAGRKGDLLPVAMLSAACPPASSASSSCWSLQSSANVPGLADVDDVHTVGTGLPEVGYTQK